MICLVLILTVSMGAAPPGNKSRDVSPEHKSRKPVYHRYLVDIAPPQPTPEQLRKLMAPLELAKVSVPLPESKFRKMFGKAPPAIDHGIYVRSTDSYEKVMEIIKSKRGVVRVSSWPAPVKRTVDELPGPRQPDPPGTVYHYFNVNIDMPRRGHEDLQKLVSPLKLMRFHVPFSEAKFRERFSRPPEFLYYKLCIRSRESYEQVEGVIKSKPGVTLAARPAAECRTLEKIPKGTWVEADPPEPKELPKR
jgi:hypothetical protein